MGQFNILDYGALSDNKTICTKAIQKAIDLCDKNGTVIIPKGTFISGAIFLKSDMTLFFEDGARLQASENIEDFPVMGYSFEGLEQLCYASLINTGNAFYQNISIKGNGVIDAGGEILFKLEMAENKGKRGRAVCIRNTQKLNIQDITIRQSPAWCLHLLYCSNILIENIQVHTKYDENGKKYSLFNGDGIDIDSCKNVSILNSLIASQDDCIAIKSGRNEQGRRNNICSENINIENCLFKSGFGVAVGSEMSGGVKDIFVRNCTFENTYSIASIKAVRGRGAYIKNIHYENCSLVNRDTEVHSTKWFKGAIYIDGFYGNSEFDADTPALITEETPQVDGIYFKDLNIDTIDGYAVYLCGLPEMPFKNIYLENVKAHGEYGIKIKNIENLQLINTDISYDKQ